MLVFPGCRFGRCVCLMVAALVYACVPSCLFNRCLCSLVAVLVGMSSSHILLYWAPAPQKGRIKAQMTFPFTAPDTGAYQNLSHILPHWTPAPDKGAYPESRHILPHWARPPWRCVSRLKPYRPLAGPRYGGVSKLKPRPPSVGPIRGRIKT